MISRAVVINVCNDSKRVLTIAELLKTGFASTSHVVITASSGNQAKIVTTHSAVRASEVDDYVAKKRVAHWLKWQLISIDALINVASHSEKVCHELANEPMLTSIMKFARGSVTDIIATDNISSESPKISQLTSQLFAQLKIPHNTVVCDMKEITSLSAHNKIDKSLADFVWNVGEASRRAIISGTSQDKDRGPSSNVYHFNAASAINLTRPLSSTLNLSYWNDVHAV